MNFLDCLFCPTVLLGLEGCSRTGMSSLHIVITGSHCPWPVSLEYSDATAARLHESVAVLLCKSQSENHVIGPRHYERVKLPPARSLKYIQATAARRYERVAVLLCEFSK